MSRLLSRTADIEAALLEVDEPARWTVGDEVWARPEVRPQLARLKAASRGARVTLTRPVCGLGSPAGLLLAEAWKTDANLCLDTRSRNRLTDRHQKVREPLVL